MAQQTPAEAHHDLKAHRLGVREWVTQQHQKLPDRLPVDEVQSVRTDPASPVAHTRHVLTGHEPTPPIQPVAPDQTTGEQVHWQDHHGHVLTALISIHDTPPHLISHAPQQHTAGAPGGPPDSSGSSSSSTQYLPRTPRAPRATRRRERSPSPLRGDPHVPEYLRPHRYPTFEPVTPGGDLAPSQARPQRGDTPAIPALVLPPPGPNFLSSRPASIGSPQRDPTRHGRRIGIDKITNMLSVAFISDTQAANRAETTPLHKLGIKSPLPKPYEGQPDQTAFENWLSLLLGFFRIYQLDVLNEAQDCARLEILGQSLSGNAHTYFRERYQKFLEQGESWDFREAILDLRDRYLYKSTPFIAARKFETLSQGNRDSQALYDDLTTQAARMIENPSDYHFRLRFMLALRPEVLDYIIKTHSISAETSNLAQIRSACEDYERSNEYGKQLAATQSRLGGSRPDSAPKTQPSNARSSQSRPQSRNARVGPSRPSGSARPIANRPSGSGPTTRTEPPRPVLKPDSKAKSAVKPGHKTGIAPVSCYECGGPHYARDCPHREKKAARGYAVRIEDKENDIPAPDAESEYHSTGSASEAGDASPVGATEPDIPEDEVISGSLEGDQYEPEEAQGYHFDSNDESEPLYSRSTRIIPSSALVQLESRAARAEKSSKKPHTIESNRARYKLGDGPQPQRDERSQRCLEVTIPINGLKARVLLDGGSNTNMISPEFATIAKVSAIELTEQMTLKLAITGSRSKVNYGTWAPVTLGPVKSSVYFDIANIDGYDAILGTPYMWEHGVSPIYEGDGWIMKDGKRLNVPVSSPSGNPPKRSFRN